MIVARLVLTLIPPAVIGWLLVEACLGAVPASWRRSERAAGLAFRGIAALMVGIGVVTCAYFVSLHVTPASRAGILVVELAIAGALVLLRLRRPPPEAHRLDSPAADPRLLVPAGISAALVAAWTIASDVILGAMNPLGRWDAIDIWNVRARILHRAGEKWLAVFDPLLWHPDYPFFVPGWVARSWELVGRETNLVPGAASAFFLIAVLAVLASSIAVLRGPTMGLLAGLVFVTPELVVHGSAQMTDLPLAFFFVGTLACIAFHDRERACGFAPRGGILVLAGALAALAAWTKNEGQLFVLAVACARIAALVLSRVPWRRIGSELAWFGAGAAPVLACVAVFQVHAPANDAVGIAGNPILQKIRDPERYGIVAKWFEVMVSRFGGLGVPGARNVTKAAVHPFVPVAVAIAAFGSLRAFRASLGIAATSIFTLALMAAGYLAVYLTTRQALDWHAQYSMERLLIQLWPVLLFALFLLLEPADLMMRTRDEAPEAAPGAGAGT